jgi:hypothetical protein
MYLTVGVVFVLMLVLASPVIWVAWWWLADFGEAVNGSNDSPAHQLEGKPRRQVA